MSTSLAITTREARADDLAFVVAAHERAHDAQSDARGGRLDTLLNGHLATGQTYWERYLDAPADRLLLIGEIDGVSVGYSAIEHTALGDGTTIASIGSLWVHEDARGVGVGAALMAAIETQAKNWGAQGLDSRALPGDRVSKNFFESFGLVARAIHVHRAI